tara:strand:+ start:384 stop:545 length:162 start_codon:yes stop_codon:yes gene_type:complete
MNEEQINQLADEISFRLMATNKHVDHEWLVGRLKDARNQLADRLIEVIQSVKS